MNDRTVLSRMMDNEVPMEKQKFCDVPGVILQLRLISSKVITTKLQRIIQRHPQTCRNTHSACSMYNDISFTLLLTNVIH